MRERLVGFEVYYELQGHQQCMCGLQELGVSDDSVPGTLARCCMPLAWWCGCGMCMVGVCCVCVVVQ